MSIAKRNLRLKKKLNGGSLLDYVPPRIGPKGLELHAPLANYMGPRTDIQRRLQEGVKPMTRADAGAKQHDISYYNIGKNLARGSITRPQAIAQVRKADSTLMRTAAKNIGSINPLEHFHAATALTGMVGKRVVENVGLIPELAFVTEKDRGDLPEGGKKKKSKDKVKGLRKRFKKIKIKK